jgi:hypothetical protein
MGNIGPIQDRRQHVLWAMLGPFKAISSVTNSSYSACTGPLQSSRQSVMPICWAHTSSWQNLGMLIPGPYKVLVQRPCICLVGPYDYFVRQLLPTVPVHCGPMQVFRSAAVPPDEQMKRAHASPSSKNHADCRWAHARLCAIHLRGPICIYALIPIMGPHGLCRYARQICTWVLPTT